MIFKEVHLPDGRKQFLMGNNIHSLKEVTEETYKKLSEDEFINNMSSRFNTNNFNKKEVCENHQEILNIIDYLSTVNSNEAVEFFNSILQDTFYEGIIFAYNEVGMMAYKIAAKIENFLDYEEG